MTQTTIATGWIFHAIGRCNAASYGRHTQLWFESAPPPTSDGEVLIVMVDSKEAPTATDEELRQRPTSL